MYTDRMENLQKLEEEMGKELFINGETYEEVVEAYMKERGIAELPDDKFDFVEWLDKRTQEHLIRHHEAVKKKEIMEIYDIMVGYCEENGDDNIEYGNVKKWCKRNKIPIPLKLEKYIKFRKEQSEEVVS